MARMKKDTMINELVNQFGFSKEELESLKYNEIEKKYKETTTQESINQSINQSIEQSINNSLIEPKKLNRDYLVTVMNYTTGRVSYESKLSGQTWNFLEFGQTDEIEMGELIRIKNSHPRYLNEPWLYILNETAIKQLGLSDMYTKLLKPEELDRFFDLTVEKIKDVLEKAPKGFRELIIDLSNKKIKDKTLFDIRKIKAIEDVLDIELNTMSS